MNKVVRENYPASRLPEDLRGELPADSNVRVTIETLPTKGKSFSKIKEAIEEARRRNSNWPETTAEEAVARVRSLRDEWI